jgi:glucoamylase
MSLRLLAGTTALGVAVTGALVTLPASDAAPPPAAAKKQKQRAWTEADKTGFGTARTRASNVWFTLQDGRTSEVFYPDLSTPSVRSLELIVTDGEFTDRASTDMVTTVSRPDPRSLRFTQVHEDEDGRYRLTETHATDDKRDAYVVDVRLESLDGGDYDVRVEYDPALGNNGNDDRGTAQPRALTAGDGEISTSLVASPHLRDTFTTRGPGDVVQRARLQGDHATLHLGFGRSVKQARRAAQKSRERGFEAIAERYDAGWHRYLDGLRDVPASASGIEDEYLASTLVVAASEDKLNPGAVVASPSAPWVWGNNVKDLSRPSGAYHLVWSRDSYEFATALWAAGDEAAARRIAGWLFAVQQKKDGSFPQNSDVRGKPVWGELQLDEVALPIVLARLTGRTGDHVWPGVRKAATFLTTFRDEESGRRAPYSPQERWENQAGYSPNSIAAQISGLVCAADIARRHGRRDLARKWLRIADRWQRRVDNLTVTTNGPLSDAPYYLRLTKNGKPNTKSAYPMGDGGPKLIDQRRVVDPSFLMLVRFGLVPADDPAVTNTLQVVDDKLKVDTPNGPFWRRFSFDGYGETRTGAEWDITESGTFTTLGRGWPILTGERGEYAVSAGQDASPYLAAMAAAAGESGMISEQVWDGRPPTGKPCCPAGEGTRAATPLTWSHGNLVRLAWTIEHGKPVDQQELVADRYR